jgi:hypothetical protein
MLGWDIGMGDIHLARELKSRFHWDGAVEPITNFLAC